MMIGRVFPAISDASQRRLRLILCMNSSSCGFLEQRRSRNRTHGKGHQEASSCRKERHTEGEFAGGIVAVYLDNSICHSLQDTDDRRSASRTRSHTLCLFIGLRMTTELVGYRDKGGDDTVVSSRIDSDVLEVDVRDGGDSKCRGELETKAGCRQTVGERSDAARIVAQALQIQRVFPR